MKLFVTDYDGTLFTDEINLSINRKKILELTKLGFIIVISTGRSFESIKNQLEKHQIYYDYLHCADGTIIYNKNDELIKFYTMDHDIVEDILSLKDEIKYEEIQITYPLKYLNVYNKNDLIGGVNIVIKKEFINDHFINKFINLKKKYPHYNFLNYNHGDYIYLCVKCENVNKAMGVKFMQEYLNISKDNIYVIGDSDNDLEMIKEYNGVSIKGDNLNVNKHSRKTYHQVYEFIDDIIKI